MLDMQQNELLELKVLEFKLKHDSSLLEIMAISSVNGTQSLVLVIFAKKSLRMISVYGVGVYRVDEVPSLPCSS